MVEVRSGGSGDAPPQRSATRTPTRPRAGIAGSGSTQNILYGTDDVKVYPINEYQLSLLGQNRGWAGLFFAIAGILFGFGMNVWVSIDLSSGVSPIILARWDAVRWMCLAGAVIFVLSGLAFLGFGHSVISKIRKRTKFE